MNPLTTILDKGIITYEKALHLQESIRDKIIMHKRNKEDTISENVLILCEHEPLLTFGSSSKEEELFIPLEKLHDVGLDVFKVKRREQ